MLLLTVLSLAPAILLMTTCFVRIDRGAGAVAAGDGHAELPPSQVITAIALFITLAGHDARLDAGLSRGDRALHAEADRPGAGLDAGAAPVRQFMSLQIERTGNSDDMWLFMNYLPDQPS